MYRGNCIVDGDDGSHPSSPYYQESAHKAAYLEDDDDDDDDDRIEEPDYTEKELLQMEADYLKEALDNMRRFAKHKLPMRITTSKDMKDWSSFGWFGSSERLVSAAHKAMTAELHKMISEIEIKIHKA